MTGGRLRQTGGNLLHPGGDLLIPGGWSVILSRCTGKTGGNQARHGVNFSHSGR